MTPGRSCVFLPPSVTVAAFPVSPIRLDKELNLLVGFIQSIIAETRSVKAEYHNSSASIKVGVESHVGAAAGPQACRA